MNPFALEYFNRIKDAVERTSALGRLSFWLERHTRIAGKPYSFAGHEFQREIIDSSHPNMAVVKPSQVGLSELSARMLLGFLAVSPDTTGMYTMPTVIEALRFSKSRIDPIIRASEYLSQIMNAGSDSASFKQLGSSQLFMAGTFGKALISIPVDFLVNDEVNFSAQEVLVTAESRLSHSRLYDETLDVRGVRRKFSTPTVPSMGVSLMFEQSDGHKRLVKCKHCGSWSWPNFLQHVVVDGYGGSMEEISYVEVQGLEDRGLLSTARLLCEHCHNPLTLANLLPEYREWVAEKPHITHTQGFAVSPFDLPAYHTPASLLRKKLEYKEEEGHFRNFALGLPYADSSNSVLPDSVKDNTCLAPVYPDSASVYGCVAGLDVGKTSWLVVARPVDGQLHVIWAEQVVIRPGDEDSLFATVEKRVRQFCVVKLVCDSMPYTDTILRIQSRFEEGRVLPNSYTLQDRRLPMLKVQEVDWSVASNRTKVLDYLVKKVNNGAIKFARFPELPTMAAHLQGMKRVDRVNEKGEWSSDWVKTGADHYFHALSYMNIAAELAQDVAGGWWSPGVAITEAVVGSKAPPDVAVSPLAMLK